MSRSTGALFLAGALLLPAPLVLAPAAHAQQSGGWFVPKSSQPAEAPAPRHRAAPPPQRIAAAPVPEGLEEQPDQQQAPGPQAPGPQPVLPLPPIPVLSPLAKGSPPPASVFGIISVPDVMRQSSAAQQVEAVLGARRDKLNADAKREQQGWQETQRQLQIGASNKTITPDQLRTRALALRAQVTTAQKDFTNRNRVIQEAAQVAIGQIERELVQVIKQVSAAHGMNFVLHREQVALNLPEFDITPQVLGQLNATLPSVFIPADGVDSEALARSGAYPTTANPGPEVGAVVPVATAPAAVANAAIPKRK